MNNVSDQDMHKENFRSDLFKVGLMLSSRIRMLSSIVQNDASDFAGTDVTLEKALDGYKKEVDMVVSEIVQWKKDVEKFYKEQEK